MIDLRPVGYVIGLLVMALGVTMLAPLMIDIGEGREHWPVFAKSMLFTVMTGGLIALSCKNAAQGGLSIQQTFVLTTTVWLALPLFGALPLMLGATQLSFTDAMFEAMSGLTTTGSTVITGLDDLPKGLLLWRGMLQWLGGIGIIVVAMVFLPELRVGGMQIFRSEAFETMGKILPRATSIAGQISGIYIGLTVLCILTYMVLGMNTFDATVHAMTTLSTGGFANYDASFGKFSGAPEYAASLFMFLAALPFVRYVQMVNGNARPFFQDTQIHTFFYLIVAFVVTIMITLHLTDGYPWQQSMREALFNIISIMSGTGYASVDYMEWGSFIIASFFFVGMSGGCAGSTACSVKVFRYQLLFASIRTQLQRTYSPNGVFITRYQGRPVTEDVLSSVMSFFVVFVVMLGIVSVALALTGLDLVTAVSGAGTALGNIGPGLGDIIGPAGNFKTINAPAKWILTGAMLIGRLELMVVLVTLTPNCWRR